MPGIASRSNSPQLQRLSQKLPSVPRSLLTDVILARPSTFVGAGLLPKRSRLPIEVFPESPSTLVSPVDLKTKLFPIVVRLQSVDGSGITRPIVGRSLGTFVRALHTSDGPRQMIMGSRS